MFKKLLVPLDGSSLAEQALASATSIARVCGATIELVTVDTRFIGDSGDFGSHHVEHVYVQGMANEIAHRFQIEVASHVASGAPVAAIVRRAHEIGADLIVMTSHGRTGFSRAWLGSVADGVIRESTIPVLVDRPIEGRKWRASCGLPFRRVLIPLDESPGSAAILDPAVDLCRWLEARPILARVVYPVTVAVPDPMFPPTIVDPEATRHCVNLAQDELTELALAIEANTRIAVETDVTAGDNVAATLIDVARRRRADLIAMATHSRGPSRLFLGSVTDKVLRGVGLPLLLLHPSAADRARPLAGEVAAAR